MDYFTTNWAAMTINDWIGTILTVGIFILMVWAYVHVFHPKNKDKLESRRYLPDSDDDTIETENRK